MMRSAKLSHPKRLPIYIIRTAMARSRTSNHIPFLPTPKFSRKNKRYPPNISKRAPVQTKALVTILLRVILLQVKHHRDVTFDPFIVFAAIEGLKRCNIALPILRFSLVFRTSEMGFCYSPESNGTRDQPEGADNHFIQMPTETLRGKKCPAKKRQTEQ